MNRKQRRAQKVPAAAQVTMLVKAPGVADAYYMALLDDRGKPFAQWGWGLQGWEQFAIRILVQVKAYKQATGNSEGDK